MKRPRTSHIAIAEMVACIVNGPATVSDIVERSGLSDATVRGYIRAMRNRPGTIYVAEYHEGKNSRRISAKAYAFGSHHDAKPPKNRTRAEIVKDYRDRKRMAKLLGVSRKTEIA